MRWRLSNVSWMPRRDPEQPDTPGPGWADSIHSGDVMARSHPCWQMHLVR